MTGSIVVDSNLVNIRNLFTNKGVILGDEDIQDICNYALLNGLIKIDLSENKNCKDDIFHIKSENKIVINFADHNKTAIVRSISKEERENIKERGF